MVLLLRRVNNNFGILYGFGRDDVFHARVPEDLSLVCSTSSRLQLMRSPSTTPTSHEDEVLESFFNDGLVT